MNRRNTGRKRDGERLQSDRARLECVSSALTQAYCALTQAYCTFNSVSDPVIMDACIFEINALCARRNSLLRDMRALEQPPSSAAAL